jgi:hypothetical protein
MVRFTLRLLRLWKGTVCAFTWRQYSLAWCYLCRAGWMEWRDSAADRRTNRWPRQKECEPVLPGYMTMGNNGMAGMGEMGMKVPRNSLPMIGLHGKHDSIDMGGMFAVVKVRKNLTNYDDPGWYENPPGTRGGSHPRGNSPRLTTDSECLRGFTAKYGRERAGNSHSSCMWNGGEHRFRTIYRPGKSEDLLLQRELPDGFS